MVGIALCWDGFAACELSYAFLTTPCAYMPGTLLSAAWMSSSVSRCRVSCEVVWLND